MMFAQKFRFLLSLLFVISISSGYSQEAATSAGGDASGSGGSSSYSVGQVAYTSKTGTSGSASEGVQHAYEIFTVKINETIPGISFSVYPNPTEDKIIIKAGDFLKEPLLYLLTNVEGKVLKSDQVTSPETSINTTTLSAATYFLQITRDNNLVQSFKIIKK